MARLSKRYSIYDVMEDKGVFEANPANIYAINHEKQSLYKGPVEYPKMMYHPRGEERVLNPGTTELINGQYVLMGRLMEIIWEQVNDAKEEKKLRAEGWHDHPSLAAVAGGKASPVVASPERVSEIDRQIALLNAEKSRMSQLEDQTVTPALAVKGSAKHAGLA